MHRINPLALVAIGVIFILSGSAMVADMKGVEHSGAGTYWYYGLIIGGYAAIVVGSLMILVAFVRGFRYMIHQHLRYRGYDAWRDLERRSRSGQTSVTTTRYRVGGGR